MDQHKWVSDEDFDRDWSLCQLAPGINLLALIILLGKRERGWPGAFVALLGLLLPSVTLTILLTAGYLQIRSTPWMLAGLRGAVPASVGLGTYTAIQMAKTPWRQSRTEGLGSTFVTVAILLGSFLAIAKFGLSAPVVLVISGGVGAAASMWRARSLV